MSEANSGNVPAGFQRLPEGLGFNDVLQPLYRRIETDTVSFGLVVEPRHGNSMGICHGGVLMTLADMTAASGVNQARGDVAGNPTINLSIDFISAAQVGEWIQADAERASIKRRFGFSNGAIYGPRGVIARFNGTFYFPDHEGMWKGGKSRDSVLQMTGE